MNYISVYSTIRYIGIWIECSFPPPPNTSLCVLIPVRAAEQWDAWTHSTGEHGSAPFCLHPPQWAESRREQPWISYFVASEALCSSASSKRMTLSQPTPDGHSLSTAAVPDTRGDVSSTCTLAPTPLFAVTVDCRGSENSKALGYGMRSSALTRGMLNLCASLTFFWAILDLVSLSSYSQKEKCLTLFVAAWDKNDFGEPGCAHQTEPHHLPAQHGVCHTALLPLPHATGRQMVQRNFKPAPGQPLSKRVCNDRGADWQKGITEQDFDKIRRIPSDL